VTPTVRDLIEAAGREFSVSRDEILSVDRHKTVAEARAVAMWLIRNVLRMSYPQIGREFTGFKTLPGGGIVRCSKDHTTVMSAVKRVDESLELTRAAERVVFSLRTVRSVGIYSDATGAREIEFDEVVTR
jgi:chromosomal replication initiation ATPase DnaA